MPKTLFRSETTKFMYFEKPEGSGRNLLVVKKAKLYAHDFNGAHSDWGTKSICVEIPEEIKDLLINDGWEIKVRIPDDESKPIRYFLPVKIEFNDYGPKIVKIAPDEPVTYTDSTVGKLDKIDMTDIDIIISPYRSEKKQTVSAYLREMRFKLVLSPLDYDYDDEEEDEEIPLL